MLKNTANRALRNLLLLTALLGIADAETVFGATRAQIRACRGLVIEQASQHAISLTSTLTRCHQSRAKLKLPAETDCNDIEAAADAVGRPIALNIFDSSPDASGEDCESVLPFEASYTSCPSPCHGIAVTGWSSVDECMRCVISAQVEELGSRGLGEASLPLSKENRKCAAAILNTVAKVLPAILEGNRECLETTARPNSCIEQDAEGRSRVARARSKTSARVSKSCRVADFGALGACATGLADSGCVLEETERSGFLLAYNAARMQARSSLTPSSTYVEVTAGATDRCALRSDGTIRCLSLDGSERASPPGDFTAIAVGDSNGSAGWKCGIRPDGSLDCWGGNDQICCGFDKLLETPTGTFLQVSGSGDFKCAIRTDHTIACWGFNNTLSGTTSPPAGTFSYVSSGADHSCAVRTDGSLACWGYNASGQASPPSGQFEQVDAGFHHSCGLRIDGTVACWGRNDDGESTAPGGVFSMISADGGLNCGVRPDGSLHCWGNGDLLNVPIGTFTHVSVGRWETCALRTDGTVTCWGGGGRLELPTEYESFSQVSHHKEHGCGLRTDGTASCWGGNSYGEGTPPSGTFTQVSAGLYFSCGIRDDGSMECWGRDQYGQSSPPGAGFVEVASGRHGACGIRADGTPECWGFSMATPPPAGPFASLSGSGDSWCALSPDGIPECWGKSYQIHLRSPSSQLVSMSVGSEYACGLTIGGRVACWGSGIIDPPAAGGPYSQLSTGHSIYNCGLRTNGSLDCWPFGRALPPPGVYSQVSVGGASACAVRIDGLRVCWGGLAPD